MTTMLPQQAQAAYRMARAEQAAERYRAVRRSGPTGRAPADPAGRERTRSRDRRGPIRVDQPTSRPVNGATASSAFATGRG